MDSAEVVLRVKGISKSYRSGFWLKRLQGLSGVNLEVLRGEIFGLLGPNGAGKTTLFKIVTGLIQPSSGEGTLMGEPLASPKARRDVGYLPENPSIYDFLTGPQFLELMGNLMTLERGRLRREVPELLSKVGLSGKESLAVRKYSKGMVQRLALAQALLGDPPVYILDEPMSGLDPVGRKLVRDIIGELRSKGKTAIFSSHVLSDAEALCDRVGLMLGGELLDVGTVASLVGGRSESIEVVLDAPSVALPAELSALGVQGQPRGGQTVVILNDERSADVLLSHAVATRVRVVTVQRHRGSLEEYFVRRAAEAHSQGLAGAIAAS